MKKNGEIDKSKILYIFTGGRKKRFDEITKGKAPSEFLFGAYELKKMSYELDIMEIEETTNKPSLFSKINKVIKQKTLKKITGLNQNSTIFKDKINKINKYDHVICGNDYIALCLYPWIKKRKIKSLISFFVMGQLANTRDPGLSHLGKKIGKKIYGDLIKECNSIIFLGEGELDLANSIYPKFKDKFNFLPFAVDTTFWKPDDKIKKEDFILSIGNDKARDWPLAIDIAKSMPEENFKFITKNKNITKNNLPSNVELIKGDWKDRLLTDKEIRNIYRKCKMVILPIHDTIQPSGQSVCLQAMACSKPVIISRYQGFWDSKNIKNNTHLIITENNKNNFIDQIDQIDKNENLVKKIKKESINLILNNYKIDIFAKKLIKIIDK
ncbi:glycosyltransferase [bacterium]|nr:glycosyltransferase [bacterium]